MSLRAKFHQYKNPLSLSRAVLLNLGHLRRVDSMGNPLGLKPIIGRATQYWVEHGRAAPYMWSQEKCQEYWSSLTNSGDHYTPVSYALKDNRIMDFVTNFWSPEVDRGNSIIELGCGSGGNLQSLYTQGYTLLSGIDINPAAIEQLRANFPDLGAAATISVGSLEELLSQLPNDSVDVVIMIAVAMHIHPRSHFLFGEMSRVAKKHICTVELETAANKYVFPRNYERIFRKLGATQVNRASLDRRSTPPLSEEYYGFTVRLFDLAPLDRDRPSHN